MKASISTRFQLSQLRDSVTEDLLENILPFWFRMETGNGFHGGLTNERQPLKDSPLALVMMTRLLWAYSRAYRILGQDEYRSFAGRIYEFIVDRFADQEFGGYFWWLDPVGKLLESKKQTYGQAFAVYGLSEYYLATGEKHALERAWELFELMETHCWKGNCGGYWEASDRSWNQMEDVRLSEKDMNSPLSMNTHLHVMEGYTNLLLATKDDTVAEASQKVLNVVRNRILIKDIPRFGLFYDADWNLLCEEISPGHDIEGSWLIWETAEILSNADLLDEVRPLVLQMADFVLHNGMDTDGSILNEYEPGKPPVTSKDWWPQAEGVVGFLNAFQMTGDQAYLDACLKTWQYIREFIIDPVNGEWFAGRKVNGELQDTEKAGPWKSAYHNGRMGFEVIQRVNKLLND